MDGFTIALVAGYLIAGLIASYITARMTLSLMRDSRNEEWMPDHEEVTIHHRWRAVIEVVVLVPLQMLFGYLALLAQFFTPLLSETISTLKSSVVAVASLVAWPIALPHSIYMMYDSEKIERIHNSILRMNANTGSANLGLILKEHGRNRRRAMIATLSAMHKSVYKDISIVAGGDPEAESIIKEASETFEKFRRVMS